MKDIEKSDRIFLWNILPRGMRFDACGATSIDLFVGEVAAESRFRTRIFAEHGPEPMQAPDLVRLPRHGVASTLRRAWIVGRAARTEKPDLVLVQQHLPSAAAMASRLAAPVVLQKHNFTRAPVRTGMLSALGEARHLRQYAALAGLTFVSDAVLRAFERDWPRVECPRLVVPNGIAPADWSPASHRDLDVLVVGRCSPEKGLVEAAVGIVAAIADLQDWTATFVVSESDRDPAYLATLRTALAPLGERARLHLGLAAPDVRALNERAAIAVIPSTWKEPFGRTCLEAHAGGAAVISSGTGGLREISDSYAVYLPEVTPPEIAAAVTHLVDDAELRRALASAGRIRVNRQFGMSRIAGALDDFCATLVEERRARAFPQRFAEPATR